MPYDLYKEPNNSGDFMFLSYKKENVDQLRQIVPHFNFDVWYDKALDYGRCWMEGIVNNLRNCTAMILFLSKASLAQGKDSPALTEYSIARDHHKDIFVVYLEDIALEDVPASLEIWLTDVKKERCLFYDANRSQEALLEEIHAAVTGMTRNFHAAHPEAAPAPKASVPTEPLLMQMQCVSSLNNGDLMYVGSGNMHISSDNRKICLYNHKLGRYEVRLRENPNYLYAAFKGKPDLLSRTRLFYTAQGKYLYYFLSGKLFIYDIARNKYINPFGTSLSLGRNEEPTWLIEPVVGNCVYLIACKQGVLSSLIRYNISTNKSESHCDLRKVGLKNLVGSIIESTLNAVLVTDSRDCLQILDMDQLTIAPADPTVIDAYYNTLSHKDDNVDFNLSHDGLLYRVPTQRGFRILDTQSHAVIHEEYNQQFRALSLLRDRVVLKLDLEGNLLEITPAGTRKIFGAEQFRESEIFGNNTPHTMLYDEMDNHYIFVVNIPSAAKCLQRVVVTDTKGNILQVSNDFEIPLSSYYCEGFLNRRELTILFWSDNSTFKKHHNTVIFTGTYR